MAPDDVFLIDPQQRSDKLQRVALRSRPLRHHRSAGVDGDSHGGYCRRPADGAERA